LRHSKKYFKETSRDVSGGFSMKKTGILLGAALLMLLPTGCKDRIEPGTAKVERPILSDAATMAVKLETVELFHEATATVSPEVESILASRIMGQVVEIKVKEGDTVKEGELLISIDSEDINKKVAAAEAGYREAVQALSAAEQNMMLAETTFKRFKNLYDEKALTRQEFDRYETQKKIASIEYERIRENVKRAEAGLAEAEVFRGYKEIVSPVEGIVTAKYIDPGTMAMPGMRLLTIEDTSRYHLEAEIDESLAGQITPGMDVAIEIRALKTKLTGKISETVPAVDPRSRTFKVFIALPAAASMQSGLYARVKIPVGLKELVLVPAKAIVTKGQLTGVYTVGPDHVITYRLVRLGTKYGENIEILSGLKPGDTIISDNVARVVDGSILQAGK
jgi:RND family efflux transporter MFP subunit